MTAAAVSLPPDEIPIAADPWQAWIDAHRDEVARYHGRRIAVHPERGIVASGKTLEELSEALGRLGYPTGEDDPIAIDVVPELVRP
jgi:hypothetical protein